MASAKQKAALKRARAAKMQKDLGLLGGFSGIRKNFNTKNIMDFAMKTGLVLVGFIGGNFIKKQFDKGDQQGIKKFIAPVALLGGGLLLGMQNNEKVKFLGYGLMGSGAVDGINMILNKGQQGTKDILNFESLKGLFDGVISGDQELPVYPDVSALPDYNPGFNGGEDFNGTPVEEEISFSGELSSI